jgi:penicillin amidase
VKRVLGVSLFVFLFPPYAAGQSALDSTARARLAVIDGTVTLAKLDSSVEVRRDRWGIPHIYARTQHDLFFAQGYVAAQDRLWQMEMTRRIGEGRLAEVLGPRMVERDRFARLFTYRGDPEREWASYAPDTRSIVTAFVDGVNAYIDDVRTHPPIEFDLLGIRPEPWRYEVPLQRMAALAMTGNARGEVQRAHLVKVLGVERAEMLWPTDPYRKLDPAPGLDLTGIDTGSLGAAADAYGAVAYARLEGSNNWVVSGARTASGKPLLANDPHRAIGNPSLRYLTHLVGPGWNVIGAGEPHLPGVAAGHNERIGFGFTIVGMDQQDVYVEAVKPCDLVAQRRYRVAADTRCYYNRGAWIPTRVIVDTILVRGEPPRIVRLEFTEHGPIVDVDSAAAGGSGRAFALRFVGTEPGTAGYLASLSLDRAQNWPMFLDAAARWRLPTENLIYADVDGNIGWVAAGLMPLRSWSGLLPVPGNGRFEWSGFLPFAELPRQFNPPEGFIATANNNILPPGYPRPLSYEWAAPYRAQRITSLLRSATKLTRGDFERLQLDELSLPAQQLVPVILGAARRRGVATRSEVATLARWNFVMARDSAAPAIYAAWLEAVTQRLLAQRAGELAAIADYQFDVPALVSLLTRPDTVFGAHPEAGRDSLVVLALEDAVRDVGARLGRNQALWHWGDLHYASFAHPVARRFDLPRVPRGGDANTINATSGGGYRQTAGASFREILDLADWDNSVATSVPGQSAQPGSPFYDNLLALWGAGKYFPLAYSRARVEEETTHLLTLTPEGAHD